MTKRRIWGIVIAQGRYRQTVPPIFSYREVTVIWGDLAVTSLFLSIPFIKGDNCDNEHTKGEKLRPCNHCDHPLAFVWGCQKFTPERGNRLPWHGSAVNRISQYSSIVNTTAGICRYGGSRKALKPQRLWGFFFSMKNRLGCEMATIYGAGQRKINGPPPGREH